MTRADVAPTVERVLKPIQQFVRGWMMGPRVNERAAALGLPSGQDLWIVGRAGVVGNGDADVAASGLAFIAPARVRLAWESLPAGTTPQGVAASYAELCCDWGREALADFDQSDLARLDGLGRRVAAAASPALGAVFAGWRAIPEPDDVGARVALTMHVLRELRGGAHIIAVQASGLTPLEAVLASPAPRPRSGPEWAEHLGWSGPFADIEHKRSRRLDAEQLTSDIMAPVLATLDEAELAEFAALVETTRNAIDM